MENKFSNLNFLASIKLSGEAALLNLNNSKNNPCVTTISNGAEMIDKPWLITRHSHSKNNVGFKLHEGDIIKFGKIIFKVKEISVQDEKSKIMNKDKLKDRTLLDNINLNKNQHENAHYDNSYNIRIQSGLNVLNQTNQLLGNINNNNLNTGLRNANTNDFNSKPSEDRLGNTNLENVEKLLIKENKKRK